MSSAQLKAAATGVNADGSALMQQLLARPMGGSFDPDAWHVMQRRDEQLIEDELLRGVSLKKFIYDFTISGSRVTGVSVVGARQLASEYGGIKSRIVATVEKRGALFIFRSFEPLNIHTAVLHELSEETDYYECIMQVDDIKTGNSIQVRKKEAKTEQKSAAKGGGTFDRPHYDVIAESKAFRNGVLSVLPQSVIESFKQKHLAAGNSSNEATIQQRRALASAHAAKHGLALDRTALAGLTFDELSGLGAAAAQGLDAFKLSAGALGLLINMETGEVPPPPAAAAPAATTPSPAPRPGAAKPAQSQEAPALDGEWTPSPEEEAEIRARELAEAGGGAPEPERKPATAAAPAARRQRAAMPAVE